MPTSNTEAELLHAEPEAATAIAEFRATESALAAMRAELANTTWDLTTVAGNQEARASRMACVKLRTSLEAKRKDLKDPHLTAISFIDTEAKRITAAIVEIENPIDAVIKADEKRRQDEKDEAARQTQQAQALVDAEIDRIRNLPLKHFAAEACVIQATIDSLPDAHQLAEQFDNAQNWARAKTAVEQARNGLQAGLIDLQNALDQQARLASRKAELDLQEAEQAERNRAAAKQQEEVAAQQRAEAERLQKIAEEQEADARRIQAMQDANRAKIEAVEDRGLAIRNLGSNIEHMTPEQITERRSKLAAMPQVYEGYEAPLNHAVAWATAQLDNYDNLIAERAQAEKQRKADALAKEQAEACERAALVDNATLRSAAQAAHEAIDRWIDGIYEWDDDEAELIRDQLAAALAKPDTTKKPKAKKDATA